VETSAEIILKMKIKIMGVMNTHVETFPKVDILFGGGIWERR